MTFVAEVPAAGAMLVSVVAPFVWVALVPVGDIGAVDEGSDVVVVDAEDGVLVAPVAVGEMSLCVPVAVGAVYEVVVVVLGFWG